MARDPSSSRAAELPPDEVIQEILLRLPPHLIFFYRDSLVCRLWRRLLHEPDFTRRFRARHRHAPPLLGFFTPDSRFAPAGEPPNCIAGERYYTSPRSRVLGCRHGRVLIHYPGCQQLGIWYPNARYKVNFPMPKVPLQPHVLDLGGVHGCLVCVHGHDSNGEDDCCSSRPFRVVLLLSGCIHAGVFPSRAWLLGMALASLAVPRDLFSSIKPGVILGNVIYWLSPQQGKIVVFHLDTNQLHLIECLPTDSLGPYDYYRIVKATGEEEVGMATVRGSRLHLFALVTNSAGGTVQWSQYRDVELGTLRGLSPPVKAVEVTDESVDTIFLETMNGVFALQLETMEVNKALSLPGVVFPTMVAYRSFDVTGSSGSGDGEDEVAKLYWKLVSTI